MKLGLLVVVAVAVLLPSFSESRIVSKCELRDKLREMIQLPRRLEEGVLTTVICEVDRRSHLNTSFVRVFGNRITTTPEPTVTTAPSTTGVNKMTTAAPTQPTSTSSTTTQLTNTTDTTDTTDTTTTTTTTSNTTTSPATTNSTISLMNTTVVSNSTGGGKRRKREAHSRSEEENKFNKKENKLNKEDNKFNKKENKFNEEEDKFNEEENKFNEEENKFNEEGMVHFGSQMDDEDETSTEDDPESIMKPWSLGLYGLFQLSDKHFCDSGYRWSRNVCCISCTAFADDDITDDIACVVNTGYWREILGSASHSCRHAPDFFNECN